MRWRSRVEYTASPPPPPAPEPALDVSVTGLVSIGDLVCEGCGRRVERGSFDTCTWWPRGCRTTWGDQRPRRCWECSDEHQRIDLVDAGCTAAAARLRYGC